MVGQALEELLSARDGIAGPREVVGLSWADCRWKSERQAKKALVRAKCDYVVETRIQAATDSGVRIHDLDLQRVIWASRFCQRQGSCYLYLSSSHVFSGQLDRQYTEDDYPDSETTLGCLLADAEDFVRDRCERHIILRMGPVFGAAGTNALTYALERLLQGEIISLDNKRRICPVANEDVARVISGVLDQLGTGMEAWGIYHYASSDPASWYEFAEVVLASASEFTEFSPDLMQLQRSERPEELNRILSAKKILNTFAIKQMPWRKFISPLISEVYA